MQMLASETLSLPFHATMKTSSTCDRLPQCILNAHDKIPAAAFAKWKESRHSTTLFDIIQGQRTSTWTSPTCKAGFTTQTKQILSLFSFQQFSGHKSCFLPTAQLRCCPCFFWNCKHASLTCMIYVSHNTMLHTTNGNTISDIARSHWTSCSFVKVHTRLYLNLMTPVVICCN